jgi:ribosomal protein S18 acetylase RimI-like enzyme
MPADADFLFHIYAGTRAAEVSSWGWPQPQQQAFLRMQFAAQQHSYELTYEAEGHTVILMDGIPVGRMWVSRGETEWRLVDISLLPEHCGRGIGGMLIGQLMDQCRASQCALRLQVAKNNHRAFTLYRRLGFETSGEAAMYIEMVWRPDST